MDATRTGNMAHLLNHSCAPNCYSRNISLRHEASGELWEHVLLCAKRPISPGEELTYDYRYTPDNNVLIQVHDEDLAFPDHTWLDAIKPDMHVQCVLRSAPIRSQ